MLHFFVMYFFHSLASGAQTLRLNALLYMPENTHKLNCMYYLLLQQ